MPTGTPLRVLVITSRPLLDPAGNPITLLDVEEERRRIRTALTLTPAVERMKDEGRKAIR